MSEFQMMSNALTAVYKAMEPKMYDFRCGWCGLQFDGGIMHNKPDVCPACGEADVADADEADKQEARNMAINKHDEFLEEDR